MTTAITGPVAVTGATGFIGRAAVRALAGAGLPVRAISRGAAPDALPAGVAWCVVPDYGDGGALRRAVDGAGCVIHLADNPDRMSARAGAELSTPAYELIRAMAAEGVARIVLASSVYARLAPDVGYGAAKRAAEAEVLGADGVQAVVLRLPPVYGPGARGGFGMLAALVRRGLPLPLARAVAARAYISRRNLCDLLVAIARADDRQWAAADGQCLEPSDGRPVGTAELVRMMAQASGRPARLVPVPLAVLRAAGRMTGRSHTVAGAIDPLAVGGNGPLRELFGWTPAERMPESLGFLGQAG